MIRRAHQSPTGIGHRPQGVPGRPDPSRLAHEHDFRPPNANAREHNGLYDYYRNWELVFPPRAEWLMAEYPSAVRFYIAGSGPGYLINELVARGRDAWGIDKAAHYLKTFEGASSRISSGDAGSNSDVLQSFAEAGWTEPPDVILTEDLFPALMTEAKVSEVLVNLRPKAVITLLHILTPYTPWDEATQSGTLPGTNLLLKTAQEWKSFVSPDPLFNTETGGLI